MKRKEGFTLVEVILAIAILGVIAISVLTIFGFGLRNISRSDKRTEEVFTLEGEINEKIFEGDSENAIVEDATIKVQIPEFEEKEIEGRMITVPSDDQNMEMKTFIPDKDTD